MQRGTPRRVYPYNEGSPVRDLLNYGLACALTLGAACFYSNSASATSIFHFENRHENEGYWRLLPEYNSFGTTENYDNLGAKTKVPNLNSYTKTQLELTAIYGITRDLSVFGRISMGSVAFETTTLNGSGSGLTDQGLGLNYRIWESKESRGTRPTSIDAQFSLDIPLYDNVGSRTSDPRQPLRGDGSLDITTAAFGTIPLNQGTGMRLFAVAGLGYTIRGSGYSSALPYQLQVVGLPEKTGLLYRLGFHGFKSMSSDPATGTAYSPQAQSSPGVLDTRDAAGSLIVDALNSSYMQLRATLGYQWGIGDQVFLTYFLPMSGTSTASLSGYLLGGQFRFGEGAKSSSTQRTTGEAQKGKTKGKLTYDLQGRVKQANDRLNLVKIDLGENDGVAKGQVFDIYRTSANGLAADLVARGVVTGVSATAAIVNLRQYKKEVWIQKGFIARRIAPKNP
jgi:hypothetical protein